MQRQYRLEQGQGMTEYIIVVALIAIAAIGVYTAFGKTVRGQMAVTAQALAGNSADEANRAHDRRKVNALIFSMLNFERSQLSILFLGRPMNATPGKTDNANDDENDADNSSRFHTANTTKVAGRRSIAE